MTFTFANYQIDSNVKIKGKVYVEADCIENGETAYVVVEIGPDVIGRAVQRFSNIRPPSNLPQPSTP